MDEKRATPEPLLSATILLVRDGARGLEVFMVQRHHQIDFATGAMVFPGGKLEPGDFDPALRERAHGGGRAPRRRARAPRRRDPRDLRGGARAARAAARRAGARSPAPRCSPSRSATARRSRPTQIRIPEIARAEDLELACDRLVPFAHWITPEFMPKRFDTWFFLVDAPADQVAVHDGHEGVDSLWIRPADAVAEAESGRRTIIFPTLLNVKKLGRHGSVSDALAAARREPVVTVLPRVTRTDHGDVLRIPEEAGYESLRSPDRGAPLSAPERSGDGGELVNNSARSPRTR